MKKFLVLTFLILVFLIVLIYISVSETKNDFRTCEILSHADIANVNFKEYDSVTVAANLLYEASLLKQIIQGEQYRAAWSAPVTVPIAFLDTLKGGLRIIEEGGGMQTHSLELEDSTGIRYSLRSLSKNPEPLVPQIAKDLGVENIIIDGISAQHPYAAIVVSRLADAVGVLHTHPTLVFVPKQSALRKFNDKFGDRLFFFEYESEGKTNWTGLSDIVEIIDTDDLQEYRLKYGSRVNIDQDALIRARLFDLLIGDWDRHAKQWGWAMKKSNTGYTAIPVAADRDNAFFNQGGIIPALVANDLTFPEIQDFEDDIEFLEGLISRFDEYFLRTASLEQFIIEATALNKLLDKPTIEKAFQIWPQSLDSLHGHEIRRKLISRTNKVLRYAREFYGILSERRARNIVLKGSEDLELADDLSKCFDCFK